MTAATIKWTILQDLNERELSPTTGHFRTKDEVYQRLVEPVKVEFSLFPQGTAEFWIVLDELPGNSKDGYLVVYSEEEELFGLATKQSSEPSELGLLIGLYGSFVDALDGM